VRLELFDRLEPLTQHRASSIAVRHDGPHLYGHQYIAFREVASSYRPAPRCAPDPPAVFNCSRARALNVTNNSQYFSTTATLLLFLDHGAKRVSGEITKNTIGAPSPKITTQGIDPKADPVVGTVTTISSRTFVLAGWVRTSHGKVHTEIQQTIDFSNIQDFVAPSGASTFVQKIAQLTGIRSVTKVRRGDRTRETTTRMAWPLRVDIVSPDNFTTGWTTRIQQAYDRTDTLSRAGEVKFTSVVSNSGEWADDYPTTKIQSGAQHYFSADSEGACYSRSIKAANGILTGITDGADCGNGD
jgi:hypothetical protein